MRINKVCKLSNETGNVAPDLATLRRRDLERRFSDSLVGCRILISDLSEFTKPKMNYNHLTDILQVYFECKIKAVLSKRCGFIEKGFRIEKFHNT
ncbi:hypothetical protein NQ318_019376 [Aromia moschata]|uniref:Uncharacterized protein n=1 Tax=Aromia moschata TaxID=1265417 RepID=A0AAV8XNI5_9CUCU|nr:hypothetical protein NQ318_019376 [Aromia moschata]